MMKFHGEIIGNFILTAKCKVFSIEVNSLVLSIVAGHY